MDSSIHAKGTVQQDVYAASQRAYILRESAPYFVTDQDVYAASQRAYILVNLVSAALASRYRDSYLTCHQPGCVRRFTASLHTGRVCISRIIAAAYCDSIVI